MVPLGCLSVCLTVPLSHTSPTRPTMTLWGQDAELSVYRSFLPNDGSRLDQLLTNGEKWLLNGWIHCRLSRKNDDDYEKDESDENTSTDIDASGYLRVSSDRLWFCAQDADHDVVVPGKDVELHALTSEPVSLYIQLRGDSEEDAPIELTLIPDNENEHCELIFEALTRLVENHPIDDDDSDQDYDDMVVGPLPGEATEEEQAIMLERLDQLLVVPPEYEEQPQVQDGGQFDDAEEEDDDEDQDIL